MFRARRVRATASRVSRGARRRPAHRRQAASGGGVQASAAPRRGPTPGGRGAGSLGGGLLKRGPRGVAIRSGEPGAPAWPMARTPTSRANGRPAVGSIPGGAEHDARQRLQPHLATAVQEGHGPRRPAGTSVGTTSCALQTIRCTTPRPPGAGARCAHLGGLVRANEAPSRGRGVVAARPRMESARSQGEAPIARGQTCRRSEFEQDEELVSAAACWQEPAPGRGTREQKGEHQCEGGAEHQRSSQSVAPTTMRPAAQPNAPRRPAVPVAAAAPPPRPRGRRGRERARPDTVSCELADLAAHAIVGRMQQAR